MAVKTIDSRVAGMGDAVVALWIAEGARAAGERICFVESPHSEIVRAFGHDLVGEVSEECMGLGVGMNTFNDEFSTADTDRTPRTERWQRTLGWNFKIARPSLQPLPHDAVHWASGMKEDRPFVVIAPRANINSRSLPIQKWHRIAWSLEGAGVRTIAIDAEKEIVESFPFYAYGFSWSHILALLASADAVAGNDSGIAHLATTLGVPAVVAMGPTDPTVVFGHCFDLVTPVISCAVECAGCHYMNSLGYQLACDYGCEALDTLRWQAIKDAVLLSLERRTAVNR